MTSAPDWLGDLVARAQGPQSARSRTERRLRGIWYTPFPLAVALAEQAITEATDRVVDPCCGGGVFLLAAAERLHDLGAAADDVVGALRGCDLDGDAVERANAVLDTWCRQRGGVGGRSVAVVADSLGDDVPGAPFDVVLGNPPFLGQLRSDTVIGEDRRQLLRARWAEAVQPYTDTAWLFLLQGVRSVAPGGRVCLVQPQSVLAARDAAPVRAAIDDVARLDRVWSDRGETFTDAHVEVCAPLIVVDGGAANDWTGPLADATGVPMVSPCGAGRLGDLAEVLAGFRDEYYGLVDAVVEGGDGRPLVTSGAIDPGRIDTAGTRFARRRWQDPRVVLDAVQHAKARRWAERQAQPKVLVASQTRVVEAAVDSAGTSIGSVPVVAVLPRDADGDTAWRLCAALLSPPVAARLRRQGAGSGLSASSCRITAAALSDLPLPVDRTAWDDATDRLRNQPAGEADWRGFAETASAAYGLDDRSRTAIVAWWWEESPMGRGRRRRRP